MARKKKQYDDDDGRVIANMNIDGMPWYVEDHKKKVQRPVSEQDEDLTKGELRSMIWGTMKAGLLIGGIFILGALIFILFCVFVWFK